MRKMGEHFRDRETVLRRLPARVFFRGPRHQAAQDRRCRFQQLQAGQSVETSRFARLLENGRIEGEVSGRWEYEREGRVGLLLDDGGARFEGVASRQWNEALSEFVVTLTAGSAGGVSVWGTRLPDQRPLETLNAIAAELSLPGTECGVTHDLDLPTEAARLATIEWTSSKPEYVAEDGTVVRPEAGVGDQVVTLTARITLPRGHGGHGTYHVEKSLSVVVRERSASGLVLPTASRAT
jgi:arabinan endo-1,5-alpha-L-arabinosidase